MAILRYTTMIFQWYNTAAYTGVQKNKQRGMATSM